MQSITFFNVTFQKNPVHPGQLAPPPRGGHAPHFGHHFLKGTINPKPSDLETQSVKVRACELLKILCRIWPENVKIVTKYLGYDIRSVDPRFQPETFRMLTATELHCV